MANLVGEYPLGLAVGSSSATESGGVHERGPFCGLGCSVSDS